MNRFALDFCRLYLMALYTLYRQSCPDKPVLSFYEYVYNADFSKEAEVLELRLSQGKG